MKYTYKILFIIFLNSMFVLKSDGFNKELFAKPLVKESVTSGSRGFYIMSKRIEYTKGEKLGEVIYLYDVDNGSRNRSAMFLCSCGNEFVCSISKIKSGHTKSCGCFRSKVSRKRMVTHDMSNNRLYYIWKRIINCCYNKKSTLYYKYGARGIKVYKEWHYDPRYLIEYITRLPYFGVDGYTLDRINNDGNYEPGNLRWATKSQQSSNRRPSKNKYGYVGVKKMRDKWQSRINVNTETIHLGTFDNLIDAVDARNNYIIDNNLQSYYLIQTYDNTI